MKVYNSREFIKILCYNGYELDRCSGDHKIFKKGDKTVVVAQKLNRMIAQRLIKENNLIIK